MCPYACCRVEWYAWHYKAVYIRYIQGHCLINRHHTLDISFLFPQLAQQYVSYYAKYNNYKMFILYVSNVCSYTKDLKFFVL